MLGAGRPEVLGVRTATPPKALAVGAPLAVSGLTVSTFTAKDGGTGVFYEAAAIEPAKAHEGGVVKRAPPLRCGCRLRAGGGGGDVQRPRRHGRALPPRPVRGTQRPGLARSGGP